MNQSRDGTLNCITARSGAGHFIQSEPILCADNAAAIETAEQLGRDVEISDLEEQLIRPPQLRPLS
jgi:hypothetical protein